MIAAVSTVQNEADIVGATFTYLLDQGVDVIVVSDGMSTDGTRDILAGLPNTVVVDDPSPIHYQSQVMNRLAAHAAELGAEWILPVDADEFWCCTDGPFPDALSRIPAGVTKLYAPMYQYVNLDWREPSHKPLPKVAYRWSPEADISHGNHDVALPGGAGFGVIEVREVQFRSFEHLCQKIKDRNVTFDPTLPDGHGAHIKRYKGWTPEQLRPVWDAMVARATVFDPIPCRR